MIGVRSADHGAVSIPFSSGQVSSRKEGVVDPVPAWEFPSLFRQVRLVHNRGVKGLRDGQTGCVAGGRWSRLPAHKLWHRRMFLEYGPFVRRFFYSCGIALARIGLLSVANSL